jgi:hypothetical protein
MANTAQQAYDAIKKLEAQGQLPLPEPSIKKLVGTFHAENGEFHYAVPTVSDTVIETVEVNGKPKTITQTRTVGKVKVGAAFDLTLEFVVTNPKGTLRVNIGGVSVSAQPGQSQLTVDVGNMMSILQPGGKLSVIDGTVWSGSASADIHLLVIRPDAAAAGAFTFPAVPIGLVYAPPPGAQNKNFAEYSSMNAFSRKISGSVSSGSTTKTADAYSISDFVGKVGGLISSISGASKGNADLQAANANLLVGLNLLPALFPDATDSTSNALTTTTEHDLQTTDTDTTTAGTPPGLGPGLGDRFIYLRNVKVAWLISDGSLIYSVLGDDGIRSYPAQNLISDAAAIAASPGSVKVGPVTNLDAATLKVLLNLDPFIGNPSPVLTAPRFVPNDPPSAGGNGTDPSGDAFTVTHDVSVTDITTQTNVSTTISDYKPGWLIGLLGGNQATENQMTFTYTSANQVGTEQKQTATVTFFAGPNDPPYLVGLFFDRLFGTFAFTPFQTNIINRPGHGPVLSSKPVPVGGR